MSLYDIDIRSLDGTQGGLGDQKATVSLMVNVASKCALTPQYEGLQGLHDRYNDQGFSVLGFPCNQFLEQEPGTSDEIAEFCNVNYGVTFPLFEKIEVNGDDRHPLYVELTKATDDEGHTGDIRWNFEKFLVSGEGEIIKRFSPTIEPDDAQLVETIEGVLG